MQSSEAKKQVPETLHWLAAMRIPPYTTFFVSYMTPMIRESLELERLAKQRKEQAAGADCFR